MTAGTRGRAQAMVRSTVVAASLLAGLLGPCDARAQTLAPAPAATVVVSPEAVRLTEIETLQEREQQFRRSRRGFAYATLGSGMVLTAGVAVALRFACWGFCDEHSANAGTRAATGLMVVGMAATVVSALAVAAYSGSVRSVRRRRLALSVTPTASLRSVGALLDFAW